ncbi:MAG TPA: class I SAM-dependent methyltransferase [Vicinamibacterales bacterium]|jgi:SAM-dependent methyltransferase
MTDADYLLSELVAAEGRHFWFDARRRVIARMAQTYFAQARRCLDLGCGTGFVLDGLRRALPGCRCVGCDQHRASLEVARQRGVTVVRGAVDRLPFAAAFDLVLALDVIEHLDDDLGGVAAIHDVLRPGGGLVLTVPQHRWLWSEVDVFSCHRRRYTRRRLRSVVEAAGFRIERMTSIFSLTLPVLLASRLRQRRTFVPSREFQIPGAMNAALKSITNLEWAAIDAGVNFPAGGSLLLVARRR